MKTSGIQQPHTFLAVICKYPKQYFIFVSYCLCLAERSTQWTKPWFHIKHWYNRTEEWEQSSKLTLPSQLRNFALHRRIYYLKTSEESMFKDLSVSIKNYHFPSQELFFWRTTCKIFLFHHSGTLENLFLKSESQFSSLRAIKLSVTATFGEPRLFTSLINTLGWKTNHFIICSLWEVLGW